MAKLTTLIPILSLFLLFRISDSLPTSDLNGGDVLLLPSDIPRAVPDTDRSAIAGPEHEPEGFVTVPLTKLDFHEGTMPLSLRFPHRRRFGRGCRHGNIRSHGMRPREISYGNDMILSNGKDRAEEVVGRSRFHWVTRRPRFEVATPWKGEDDVFQRPKKFRRYDEDDDVFKRLKKFDHDDEDHVFEIFRTPRKFMHPDNNDDWHREKNRDRHHHKHHHDDDADDEEEYGVHEHGKHRHHDDDEDDKSGILPKMRKFFDDLF